MALDLNALAGKTAVTNVSFLGQSTKVTYDPTVLTADALNKAQTSDEEFMPFFLTLVKAWDVTRGKGKVPLTKAGISSVPLVLLQAIFKTIMTEASDPTSGKASSDG